MLSHKKLVIPANYQSGLTNTAYVGQIIGLFINGYCQERFGSRLTFIWGMGLMTATIFLAVFSVSLNMLLVAELAMGVSTLCSHLGRFWLPADMRYLAT